MKFAILLPGYLDSPSTEFMTTFENQLKTLGYQTVRLDPCGLWETKDDNAYTITNYLKSIKAVINKTLEKENPSEIILIGHSLGGFVAIVAAEKFSPVTKVISLCSPHTIGKSKDKWEPNGYRDSTRPISGGEPEKTITFKIPISFLEDGSKYSALKSSKKLKQPLMIVVAMDDINVTRNISDKLIETAKTPYVEMIEELDHEFIYSKEKSLVVWNRIKDFIIQSTN